MKFCPKLLPSKSGLNDLNSIYSTVDENTLQDQFLIEMQFFNDAMVDNEITQLNFSIKSKTNEEFPLKINTLGYTFIDQLEENPQKLKLLGKDNKLQFNGRSFMNIAVLISKTDIDEIKAKTGEGEVLLVKFNDHKEIIVNNGKKNIKIYRFL